MGPSLPRSLRGGGPYAPPRQHAPEGVTSARQRAGVRSSAASPRRWVRAGTSAHALGATEARAARGAGPADTEAEGISRFGLEEPAHERTRWWGAGGAADRL